MNLPKILIIGESESGKDELCKILAEQFGYTFVSASKIACELVVFDKLKDKYGYKSAEECHADRRNHIPEWVDIIAEYNEQDGAALAKKVMKISDIYCGVRKRIEFDAMVASNIFDCIIYIDAYKRLPELKQKDSYVEVTADDAHFTVDNNTGIKQLVQNAKKAHARAMQILANKDEIIEMPKPAVFTREHLTQVTQEEKQALLDDIKEKAEAMGLEPPEDLPEPPKVKTKTANKAKINLTKE